MPRFAASLTMMFDELPLPERFDAAARAGFRAVEIQDPYGHAAADLAACARRAGVEVVLINLPPAGERGAGLAGVPGRERDFDAAVETGLAYARALDCPRIHALAGVPPGGASPRACEAVLVENLRRAAAAGNGVRFMVEAINRRDMPGYLVAFQDQARRVVETVATDRCRLQFDFYHTQVMEGDLARGFEAALPLIDHVQVSDNPGRHEPGTGEIAYPFLFDLLDRHGYTGWVGCEYRPRGDTLAGLTWAREWGIGRGAGGTER